MSAVSEAPVTLSTSFLTVDERMEKQATEAQARVLAARRKMGDLSERRAKVEADRDLFAREGNESKVVKAIKELRTLTEEAESARVLLEAAEAEYAPAEAFLAGLARSRTVASLQAEADILALDAGTSEDRLDARIGAVSVEIHYRGELLARRDALLDRCKQSRAEEVTIPFIGSTGDLVRRIVQKRQAIGGPSIVVNVCVLPGTRLS